MLSFVDQNSGECSERRIFYRLYVPWLHLVIVAFSKKLDNHETGPTTIHVMPKTVFIVYVCLHICSSTKLFDTLHSLVNVLQSPSHL